LKPTSRKLVIVARDNVTLYESLKRSLGNEEDVEIVFDRRVESPKSGRLGESVKKIFSREPQRPNTPEDRRRRTKIDEQIKTQGWAIVREEGDRLQVDEGATARYKKLRDVWPTPERRGADRVGSVLLDHNGVCFDCLAEHASVSLNDVMSSVRRMQVDFLLAFTTRTCEMCARKSLVGYVRDRYVLDERLDR
jgi:hypothetical protein